MKGSLFFKLCVLVLACCSLNAVFDNVAAGNIYDTEFSYSTTAANTGLYATDCREKQDDTSSYVLLSAVSNTTITKIMVQGAPRSSGLYTDRTAGNYKSISPGQSKYLPNYVYENGEFYCRLWFEWPARERVSIFGVWSPDSV